MNVLFEFSLLPVDECFVKLDSSRNGLSDQQARERQLRYGRNELPPTRKRSAVLVFLKQFKSILVGVLIAAATLSWLTGHKTDAYIILVVVLIDGMIGFIQEWRAERAVSALQKMLIPNAKVLRNGQQQLLKSFDVVPGDVIILEEGDVIPADARLFELKHLRTMEASLTGESLPVSKVTEALSENVSIGDLRNMVWKSTFVTGGYARAVVTGTALNTVIGNIASTVSGIKAERSHFQKKIDKLGTQMGIASVVAAIALFIIGYITLDLQLDELLLLAVAAMVSIIPEGLPSIIAIVLAIGSRRMTKRNAIVREFTATETLGAVTTIITDKTGTLTENALTVKKVYFSEEKEVEVSGDGWTPIGSFQQSGVTIDIDQHSQLKKLVTISALCNNSTIRHNAPENKYDLIGDPTEGALLVLSRKAGIDPRALNIQKIDDMPFNSDLKMRTSLVRGASAVDLFVIGAPEQILAKCNRFLSTGAVKPMDDDLRGHISRKVNDWSLDAMRVIALAYTETSETEIGKVELKNLIFTGIVGMIDPPRKEAKKAIQQCKDAGIRVIMATGDHISTALSIARSVGIIDGDDDVKGMSDEQLAVLDENEFDSAIRNINVFARLNPNTKLRIATRLQEMGELIAMTGDGVNDAPALRKADVGIAMGIMGTDVARDSAKVILADDNFSSIVHAIEEGRTVFINARQASYYLITTNLAEISTLIITISLGLPMPLTAIQLLWLNLVTDGIGDMALAAERGHGDILKMKPLRRDERIINKSILPFLFINVGIMTTLAIGAYHYFLPSGINHARSGVFTVMAFTQLFNMYNMRSLSRSIFQIGFFSNTWVTITMISSALVTISIIEIPVFQKIFDFQSLTAFEIAVLILASSLVFVGTEIYKYWRTER